VEEEPIVDLIDELLMLEEQRLQRPLEAIEARRWIELQRFLTMKLCEERRYDERRDFFRMNQPFTVHVVSAGTVFDATAIDLGAGGMGLSAGVLPSVGEDVTIEWAESASGERFQLDLPARVVWMRKAPHEMGPGFGVSFAPQHRSQEHAIAQLVLWLLRRERAARLPTP
jgi:c-di-GMP-binding flagellar brake protein YcgR